MVKLRLTRLGKKREAYYRVVAVDSRVKRDGKYIEVIGNYNPRTKPSTINFDKEKVEKWLELGAQPTQTVKSLLISAGILKKDKKIPKAKKTESKKAEIKTKKSESKASKTAKK